MSVSMDSVELRKLMGLLGDAEGDLRFFLPLGETMGAGADVQDLGNRGLHATNPVAADNASVIRGGLMSRRLNGTDEYMQIADNVLLTPVDTVDIAFSVGCAFKLDSVSAAIKTLIGKWDLTTPNAEWRLSLTALEYPAFEVFDDSVGGSNMGREDQTAVAIDTWYIVIGTYDGRGTAAPNDGMSVFRWDGAVLAWNGAVDDANIDGGGVYVDMENTATNVHIGADYTGGAVSLFFPGEVMMPFMTMRDLSVTNNYGITGAEIVARQMVRIMEL